MALISATQLKEMITCIPNAWVFRAIWVHSSGICFHNTYFGWAIKIEGKMVLIKYIEAMFENLPDPSKVNADSINCPMVEQQSASFDGKSLRWEKGIFPDDAGNDIVEWALPII